MSAGQQFASDNWAGIAPEALQALLTANGAGHAPAYGDDAWTQRACDAVRRVFERDDIEVFFVFNGGAANGLALAALCKPYDAVVCSSTAHIANDEVNGLAFFGHGVSLLTAEVADQGKLTPVALRAAATQRDDLHWPRARALSLTQTTELGGVYSLDQLASLTSAARELQLRVHMDGARFANAVAALGCTPAEACWRAGVDVLSFGMTKNGAPAGEAVVFFDRALADGFAWRAKQAGQLASKMRMLAAPWVGMLEDGAWLRHAAHANAMARRLGERIGALPGVELLHAPQANAVFAWLPRAAVDAVRARGWRFHEVLPPRDGLAGCRLMCAWDTPAQTVDAFVADLSAALR
jgi:threonine aldolase